MPSETSEAEAQNEAQDEGQNQAQREGQDEAQGEEEFEPPPEPDYPEDGVGLDGSPVDEILKDREERLDPDNRPENSEVSNAGREFDEEKGMFTDEEGYEEAEKKYDPKAT